MLLLTMLLGPGTSRVADDRIIYVLFNSVSAYPDLELEHTCCIFGVPRYSRIRIEKAKGWHSWAALMVVA
jgi:hypothetical protein